jgi:tetratricopeptide (TPR) repeat protein
MIVRDEARMIDACLASVKGIVSEIIVVDTGSTDDTRERAKRFGARVFDVPWQNDFSHARNAALARASGDWVLILDADERLVCRSAERLRDVLGSARFDCGMIRIHDAARVSATEPDVLSGKERMGDIHHVPRLLRRLRDLEYVGVIHENVGPWVTKHGTRIAEVDVDIVHYGATREIFESKKKLERNTRLLRTLAADTPEDPTALGYLAAQHLDNGELEAAYRAAEEGWQRLRYVEAATGYRPSILRLADVRALVQLWMGDPRGVLETVQRAKRYEGEHYDLDHLAGYAMELIALGARDPSARARYLASARACFERCIASAHIIYWHAFVVGASTWSAWTRLGSISLLLGDYERARTELERALEIQPGIPEARLGLLEVTIRDRGGAPGLAMVRELMNDEALRKTPDLWVLAASACEELGAIDDMARFLGEARSRKQEYVSKARRSQHAERIAALALYRGTAVAGPGLVGTIGALVARKPIAPDDVGAFRPEKQLVATLVRNVTKAGHLSVLEPLFEPRASIVMPGIAAEAAAAARDAGANVVYEPPPQPIVVCGEDADLVRDLLLHHPRVSSLLVANDRAPPHDGARVVLAGSDPRAGPPVARVSWAKILEDPVTECDRLLAALGEGDARPLVRHVIDFYPQPARSS